LVFDECEKFTTQQLQQERDKVKRLREALDMVYKRIRSPYTFYKNELEQIEQTLKETE